MNISIVNVGYVTFTPIKIIEKWNFFFYRFSNIKILNFSTQIYRELSASTTIFC